MMQDFPMSLDGLLDAVAAHRSFGRQIVFTNGCFDLLHAGHLQLIQEAASLGDVLIVAVNSDASVRQLKGANRPIAGQSDRIAALAALPYVDHVILFDDATPCRLLHAIRPDILIKGGTYTVDEVVGREIVEAYGGQVCVGGRVDGVSTTLLIEAAREVAQ